MLGTSLLTSNLAVRQINFPNRQEKPELFTDGHNPSEGLLILTGGDHESIV